MGLRDRQPPAVPRCPTALPEGLRFLTLQSLPLLFDFPQDMARVPAEVNRLSNQVLVHTYEREWGQVTMIAAHEPALRVRPPARTGRSPRPQRALSAAVPGDRLAGPAGCDRPREIEGGFTGIDVRARPSAAPRFTARRAGSPGEPADRPARHPPRPHA